MPFFLFDLSTNLVTSHSVVSVLNVVGSPVIKDITILTKIQDGMCDFVNHKVYLELQSWAIIPLVCNAVSYS